MTDRELLESAAKAAGLNIKWWAHLRSPTEGDLSPQRAHTEDGAVWSPLTDDGDAMRLAVKLDISLHQQFAMVVAEYPCIDAEFNERNTLCEGVLDDHCASSRRAIVRAAAAIGKNVDAPLVRADLEG